MITFSVSNAVCDLAIEKEDRKRAKVNIVKTKRNEKIKKDYWPSPLIRYEKK
jgi:hypothetical protein